MVTCGVVQTRAKVAQMLAKAEEKTQQQRLAKQAGLSRQFAEERRRETKREKQAKQEAKLRYAQQRRSRQARKAARLQRQKAKVALEAAARGEYPMPWASREEAKAKVKEAEANRREAARREQFAGWTYQQKHQRQLQGEAERDKRQAAQQKAEAEKEIAKQRRWQRKKREKHNGLSLLQPEVNMIDMSLNSPCLAIPCLANTRLMEQA